MQGMLDNLSQPVAFATIPLSQDPAEDSPNPVDRPTSEIRSDSGNVSSDTDLEEPILSKFSRKIGLGRKLGDRSQRTGRKAVLPASKGSTSSKSDLEFEDEEGDDFLDAGLSVQ